MKLPARILLAVALAAAGSRSGAAGVVLDLGQGLAYFRVHELPADLPTAPPGGPRPCIVDLRFAKADGPAAAALAAWVKFNAGEHSPVFVLENADTSPLLLAMFPGNAPAVVVVVPAAEKLPGDVSVHVGAETDRQAYDAVEKGATIASLLSDNPDKPRLDEAYLEREHLSDSAAPDIATDKPSPPSPLVDFMIQKAVQLHRGLLALKRI